MVLTYHALNETAIEFINLLASKYRLLFVFDEAHHGADGQDTAMNSWGQNMLAVRDVACSIIAMTGTPVRADNKKIPFLQYEDIQEMMPDGKGRRGYRVEPSYKFTYRQAVQAGVARRILCVNVDPTIEYLVTDDYGSRTLVTPLSQVPDSHLKSVKYTPLDKSDGIIDEMLLKAHDEIKRMRRNGDTDAACLVIGQRNSVKVSDALTHICSRIKQLLNINAVSVESADGEEARKAIKAFKRGREPFIVAKDMISEGTNLPRIRVVCILRNIGNSTFYEQLVHRATRNDADDRPEDAIIIQLTYRDLVQWGATLEEESKAVWLPKEQEGGGTPPGTGTGDKPDIQGINATLEEEYDEVIIAGEDYTDTDPVAKMLFEEVSPSGVNRAQLNVVLRKLSERDVDIQSIIDNAEKYENGPSLQQELQEKLVAINSRVKYHANNGPDDYQTNIRNVWRRLKRAASVTMPVGEIMAKHDHPERAINIMLRMAKSFKWNNNDKEGSEQ